MSTVEQVSSSTAGSKAAGPGRGQFVLGLALMGALLLRGRLASPAAAPEQDRASPEGHPSAARPRSHAEDAGRGQDAQTPSEIPATGWKDIAWRVYEAVGRDRVMLIAAGVTYYALLALFPAIAALVSLFGLFADPEAITAQLSNLEGVLPGGALEIIGDQISRIQAQGGGTLSLYFFIGLLISLWSANAGVKSVFDALNAVYQESEKRSFLRYNLEALMFTLGGILFVILAIGVIVVMPAVFSFLGLESMAGSIVSIARWPVLLLVTLFALALVYRYGPSRDLAEWRWVTWGSGIAAVGWLVVSMLYSWYVGNFGSFNETYGSLGAVIGFMIWMWLSTTIVLVGAEINAQLEHQTRKDTTTGEPRPMGRRGAHYADRVAAG